MNFGMGKLFKKIGEEIFVKNEKYFSFTIERKNRKCITKVLLLSYDGERTYEEEVRLQLEKRF